MIRIVLLGRTGNNLFQYALGRTLAEKHGVPLVLDASWFNRKGWDEVSHFLNLPIRAKVVRRVPLAARALRRITGKHYWEYRGIPVLRESTDDKSFDSGFLDAPADCMLFGYFQSPQYFGNNAASLRSELNFLISGAVQLPSDLSSRLSGTESVAVHVRRTDYLEIPAFHVCNSAYYQDAMRSLRSRLANPRFFIFSDDPDWCRAEFRERDQEVVDSGKAGKNPLHDLRLMSLASHHIIANSSYSWWAAWLAAKADQKVIMPDRWYASDLKAPIGDKIWKNFES